MNWEKVRYQALAAALLLLYPWGVGFMFFVYIFPTASSNGRCQAECSTSSPELTFEVKDLREQSAGHSLHRKGVIEMSGSPDNKDIDRAGTAASDALASEKFAERSIPELSSLKVEMISGKKKSLKSISRPAVLHFWSTTCSSCITELPIINALWQRYPKNVVVISVDFDPEDARTALLQLGYNFPIHVDPTQELMGSLAPDIETIPLTILVSPAEQMLVLNEPVKSDSLKFIQTWFERSMIQTLPRRTKIAPGSQLLDVASSHASDELVE